jgi:hypothetical protein
MAMKVTMPFSSDDDVRKVAAFTAQLVKENVVGTVTENAGTATIEITGY